VRRYNYLKARTELREGKTTAAVSRIVHNPSVLGVAAESAWRHLRRTQTVDVGRGGGV